MDIQLERIERKDNPSNSMKHYSSFNLESRNFDYFFDKTSKDFYCNICSYKSKHKSNTIKHVRTHSGFKPYKCETCNSSFAQLVNLKTHMRTHTGKKPYECDLCNFFLSYSSNLKVHMRTHTGEKPYECGICNSSFTCSSSLKKHMCTHTGVKPTTDRGDKERCYDPEESLIHEGLSIIAVPMEVRV